MQTRALYPVYNVFNGIPVVGFESMPDLVPIVYNKEVPIFKQQAAYFGQIKELGESCLILSEPTIQFQLR